MLHQPTAFQHAQDARVVYIYVGILLSLSLQATMSRLMSKTLTYYSEISFSVAIIDSLPPLGAFLAATKMKLNNKVKREIMSNEKQSLTSKTTIFDVQHFFRRKKYDMRVKKLNILCVVPMTTLLDQTADIFLRVNDTTGYTLVKNRHSRAPTLLQHKTDTADWSTPTFILPCPKNGGVYPATTTFPQNYTPNFRNVP